VKDGKGKHVNASSQEGSIEAFRLS
jgi:hypothetical protein